MDLGRSQVAFGGWSEVLRGSQEFTSVIAFKPNPHNKGWKQDGTPTLETILPTHNCRATAKEGNLFLEMPVAGTHKELQVSGKQDGTCNSQSPESKSSLHT